ncbi:MAG TPA: DsbA family protein [Terriglobales bacterium]|nr:DsbA family protein [Terriglobales bacterium]
MSEAARKRVGGAAQLQSDLLLPNSCIHRLNFGLPDGGSVNYYVPPDRRYAFFGGFHVLAGTGPPPSDEAKAEPAAAPSQASLPATPAPAGGDLSAAQRAEIESGNAPRSGPAAAPVTIVEFADFQCPYCARLAVTLQAQVLPRHQKDVRLIFRQFPLPMHPWADEAARLSECALSQGQDRFWTLYNFFYSQQDRLASPLLSAAEAELGKQPGFDPNGFEHCANSPATGKLVASDAALAHELGVRGTPTLFINGLRMSGAQSAAAVEDLIQRARTSASTGAAKP